MRYSLGGFQQGTTRHTGIGAGGLGTNATRIDSNLNFCVKQPQKVLAFFYGNFDNSKSGGSIH